MKTYDEWPCLKCLVRPICSKSCERNVRFYEVLIHEFSLNPRRTIERYTFFQGKTMDWILQRSIFRMLKFMDSSTRIRFVSGGRTDDGPCVTLRKQRSNVLRKLYERSPNEHAM